METTTDTESTIALSEKILSSVAHYTVATTISYAFSLAVDKSLYSAPVKICTSTRDPLFHNIYDCIISRKMSRTSSFNRLNIWNSKNA